MNVIFFWSTIMTCDWLHQQAATNRIECCTILAIKSVNGGNSLAAWMPDASWLHDHSANMLSNWTQMTHHIQARICLLTATWYSIHCQIMVFHKIQPASQHILRIFTELKPMLTVIISPVKRSNVHLSSTIMGRISPFKYVIYSSAAQTSGRLIDSVQLNVCITL